MTAYSVSGTSTPDATTLDTGEPAGTYNGQNYWSWTNDAGTWFLWFSGAQNSWKITTALGSIPRGTAAWEQPEAITPLSPTEEQYSPNGEATGTGTVAEAGPPPDNTPDAFDFADVTDADPSTLIESDEQIISGCDAGTAITAGAGLEYQLAGGAWTSEAGVTDGTPQTIKVRATSSVNTGAPRSGRRVTKTLTVGTLTVTWTITTAFVPQYLLLRRIEFPTTGGLVLVTGDLEN